MAADSVDWTEPGIYQVAPGVHRMPLPLPMDGLKAVNVYVLETDDGLTLIDGGWAIPESRLLFEEGLANLGYRICDIRSFLVTHMHRDHYTQARAVGSMVGAPVVLGIGEKPTFDLMSGETPLTEDPILTRLRLCGAESLAEQWRRLMPAERPPMDTYGPPDQWLTEDTEIAVGRRRLQALSTPGHTQGHYVFADRAAGLLFAGDHVLPRITPSIGFEPAFVQQPLGDFLDSLAKVRALPDLRLLPAHGPVTSSTHFRIDELLEHHRVRLDQCAASVFAGRRTAWAVAADVPWTSRGKTRDELGPFDVVLAAFETLAHLELLVAQGRLGRGEAAGVVEFSPVDGPKCEPSKSLVSG